MWDCQLGTQWEWLEAFCSAEVREETCIAFVWEKMAPPDENVSSFEVEEGIVEIIILDDDIVVEEDIVENIIFDDDIEFEDDIEEDTMEDNVVHNEIVDIVDLLQHF
uniref:Uncharacterized protein n=1 Tax=Tanacetum cinerariifolium TaxID=118510 RepID=A0A699KD50_TANCI|nr:hypothetical protein [Tanacetum cinerariifolium]